MHAKAFGVGTELAIKTAMTAIAPKPFMLEGTVKVVIEMPWFLPDINVDAALTIGGDGTSWPDEYPLPEAKSPVERVSFFTLDRQGRTDLEAGTGADITGPASRVPIDAGLLIAFNAPVGNEPESSAGGDERGRLGSLLTNGHDQHAPVWVVSTTGTDDGGHEVRYGHRYVIESIALKKRGAADGLKDLPAKWVRETHAGNLGDEGQPLTKGGIVDRSALQVLDVSTDQVVRLSGSAEALLREHLEAYDPCEKPPRLKELLRYHTMRSLRRLLSGGSVDSVDDSGVPVVPRPVPSGVGPLDSPLSTPRLAEGAGARLPFLKLGRPRKSSALRKWCEA